MAGENSRKQALELALQNAQYGYISPDRLVQDADVFHNYIGNGIVPPKEETDGN
jgi:hypothetical protein